MLPHLGIYPGHHKGCQGVQYTSQELRGNWNISLSNLTVQENYKEVAPMRIIAVELFPATTIYSNDGKGRETKKNPLTQE
jgi:hypothetical protein